VRQHALGALRIRLAQPLDEQVLDLVREPQQHIAGGLGAGVRRGVQQVLELVLGQGRNNRGHQRSHRDAGRAQTLDCAQAPMRRRCTRLEAAFEARVEAGEADHHRDGVVLGERVQ
jgi:hypothetical protein